MSLGVVWLKRDLRLFDHAPLVSAALRGPLLCVYIVEPSLWAAPDAARQHYGFLLESLRDLYRALRELGGRLHVITGEAVDVFERLHRAQPFDTLYSHEETGNWPSFQRDIAVGRWCRSRGVEWQEFPQFGVVRRLADRNTWHKHWEAFVTQPCLPPPQAISFAPLPWPDAPPPTADALGLPAPAAPEHPQLAERGATFVTLTRDGELRGCIGSLNAHRPLGQDVRDNAVSAALRDPRFPPLTAAEFAKVRVEVSLLSEPDFIEFRDEADALAQLVPGRDGVIFFNGCQRATFLPQVWEQLPEPRQFMAALKQKARLPVDFWGPNVMIARYQVRKWHEGTDQE